MKIIIPSAETIPPVRYAFDVCVLKYGSQPAQATKSPGNTPETERTIEETPYSFVLSIPLGVIAKANAPIGISKAVYVTSSPTKRKVVHAIQAQSGKPLGIPRKNNIITRAINHGARLM